MAKPEWGTKRTCASCGAKFYDMLKSPPVCPKCGAVYEMVVTKGKRPAPKKDTKPVVVPENEVETDKADRDDDPEGELLDVNDDLDVEDDESDDEDIMEDTSDLGEDDDDMTEVMEHMETEREDD